MQKILSMEISIEINANLFIQTLFSYNTNIPTNTNLWEDERQSSWIKCWGRCIFVRFYTKYFNLQVFTQVYQNRQRQMSARQKFSISMSFLQKKNQQFQYTSLELKLRRFWVSCLSLFQASIYMGSVFLFQPKILKEKSFHLSLSKSSLYLFL